MTNRYEQIYNALEQWRREQEADRSRNRALDSHLQELTAQRQHAIDELLQGLNLKLNAKNVTLQQAVDTTLREFDIQIGDREKQIEVLSLRIAELSAEVSGLLEEREGAIGQMTLAMELDKNRNRTLANSVAEAIVLINEAKRIIREHL